MMAARWFAGLMTGTVLDGRIDIAFLRTNGRSIEEFGPYGLVPYDSALPDRLGECLQAAREWNFEGPEPAVFAIAEHELTVAQAKAVERFAGANGISLTDIAAIGFHGQTVLHRPPAPDRKGQTRQLGDGQLMAEITGRPVVFDLRSSDIKAGGQGAPLCPCYHDALLHHSGCDHTVAIVNLGGIGNITWRDRHGTLFAFDTGPANAPINDWVRQHGRGEMDRGGLIAAAGRVDEARLAALLENPYFAAPFPKSLDRFDFPAGLADGLSVEDGAALLTAFAAADVARAVSMLPETIDRLVICGGGRHNPTLMRDIAHRSGVTVLSADDLGWRGDAIEAECFAYLAARCVAGLDASYPGTTGVPAPLPAGRLIHPRGSATLCGSGDKD